MTFNVSRGSAKPCSCCGKPRDREPQRYCRRCQTEYNRHRRHGKIETLLTPAEHGMIMRLRAEAAGTDHDPETRSLPAPLQAVS